MECSRNGWAIRTSHQNQAHAGGAKESWAYFEHRPRADGRAGAFVASDYFAYAPLILREAVLLLLKQGTDIILGHVERDGELG